MTPEFESCFAVLPPDVKLLAVGGPDMAGWRAAGAAGVGIGGELYKPGLTAAEVGARARGLVDAWRTSGA